MESQTDHEDIAGAVAPASTCSGSLPETLKYVDWWFPLGCCHARLIIQADKIGELEPEDMDALCEMAAILKRQLERRKSRLQNVCPLATPPLTPEDDAQR